MDEHDVSSDQEQSLNNAPNMTVLRGEQDNRIIK